MDQWQNTFSFLIVYHTTACLLLSFIITALLSLRYYYLFGAQPGYERDAAFAKNIAITYVVIAIGLFAAKTIIH